MPGMQPRTIFLCWLQRPTCPPRPTATKKSRTPNKRDVATTIVFLINCIFLSNCVYLSKHSSWYFLVRENQLPLPSGKISPDRGHSCPHAPKAKIFPQSLKDANV